MYIPMKIVSSTFMYYECSKNMSQEFNSDKNDYIAVFD